MLTWPSPKDPDETEDYQIDWRDRLGADSVLTSAWTVPAGITKVSDAVITSGKFTVIRLSGGTLGATYELLNRITSAGGQIMDQSAKLLIRSK